MDIVPHVGRALYTAATYGSYAAPSPVALAGRAIVGWAAQQAGAAAGRAAATVANAAVSKGKELAGRAYQGARELSCKTTGYGCDKKVTSMASRKRSYSTAGSAPYTPAKRARVSARVPIVPGYTRRVGNYGRYQGPNAEKKYFDTALSFSFDTTGEVPASGQLALIPQGDTESTRDGRKATIKSIQIRALMYTTPGAAATFSDSTNLYLVLDTQCNGAAAAATDVFTSTAFNSALLNLNNSGRFRILKHWVHNWGATAGVGAALNTQTKQLEYFKRCNIPMDWSSTTGAITEIKSNNIFLMAGSSGASDDIVTVVGTCRLRFQG